MSDSYIALVEKSIDERTQQYQELLRLRAENERLREALKPFAALGRLAKKLDDNTPCKTTIMSGHLRVAAATLKETTE